MYKSPARTHKRYYILLDRARKLNDKVAPRIIWSESMKLKKSLIRIFKFLSHPQTGREICACVGSFIPCVKFRYIISLMVALNIYGLSFGRGLLTGSQSRSFFVVLRLNEFRGKLIFIVIGQ